MLPEKNVCRLCFFSFLFCSLFFKFFVCFCHVLFVFFFFATSFISISFLKTSPRLPVLLHLPPGPPLEKKPTRRQVNRDTYIIYFLPFLCYYKSNFSPFFSLSLLFFPLFLSSVCEDQVGKVRLQPVPGDHLTELWRAIVWELKVRAQAALAERVQVLIHKRQGEVS